MGKRAKTDLDFLGSISEFFEVLLELEHQATHIPFGSCLGW